jgi:hypothetical protein
MYELYDTMTIMFFYRNKHMMCDFGTGNNNKLNWVLEDKQELIDIIETIYKGAKKGRGLVVSPKGRIAHSLRRVAKQLLTAMQIIRRDTGTECDTHIPDEWRIRRTSVAAAPFYEYYDHNCRERNEYKINH